MVTFLQFSLWKKGIVFLSLPLLIHLLPLNLFFTLQEKEQALLTQQARLKKELHHKNLQLTLLKQKQTAQALTPELARQLLPIDQHILKRQHRHFQVVNLQWRTTPKLFLTLEIHCTFREFQRFFNDFLHKFTHIQLIELQIEKENPPFITIKSRWQFHFPSYK